MLVLDTHTLIWAALTPDKLSPAAVTALQNAESGDLFICDISLWEIAMLLSYGRLQIDAAAQPFMHLLIEAFQLKIQPITPHIAALTTQPPLRTAKDPADRLIAATALALDASLLTADRALQAIAALPTLW